MFNHLKKLTVMKLTLSILLECNDSITNTIEYAQSFYPKYPERVSKPVFYGKTAAEALEFAKAMELYETEKAKYDTLKKEYYEKKNEIDSVIEEFIKDMSGFNNIPKQYQDKVYAKAYSDGHSEGFDAVYNELCNLVEIFS